MMRDTEFLVGKKFTTDSPWYINLLIGKRQVSDVVIKVEVHRGLDSGEPYAYVIGAKYPDVIIPVKDVKFKDGTYERD